MHGNVVVKIEIMVSELVMIPELSTIDNSVIGNDATSLLVVQVGILIVND